MMLIDVHTTLREFSLDVRIAAAGGVVALFGASGCGKSSTINLIAGLLTAQRGVIRLNDQVLLDTESGINVPCEQRRIGYVFQDARLFPHLTVKQNLHYGLQRARGERVFSPAQIVDLLGLHSLLQEHPARLSGGEQQRVALGRALLAQPQLLLLDEPLASLDWARRAEVLPYLERVRDQLRIAMLYVSHQFEEVLQLANHVVLLERGQVLAQGDLPSISLHPALPAMIGQDALGSVLDGVVTQLDPHTGLASIGIGDTPERDQLNVAGNGLTLGQPVRLQLLARDVMLATTPPQGLSVRNQLAGQISALHHDRSTTLAHVNVGGITLLARITRHAADELQLHVGMSLWLLVKAVTLRGHVFQLATHLPQHETTGSPPTR